MGRQRGGALETGVMTMLFWTAACVSLPPTSGSASDGSQDGERCPADHMLVNSAAEDFWEARSVEPFRQVCVSSAEYRCFLFVDQCGLFIHKVVSLSLHTRHIQAGAH